ncbi:MAG: enoyl-CoA hydratase/isomerase family protein [Desulfobacterales bacterium]|nr:enoyl-CoA hydratase/isomerase family protein [Desulfobacterales bacterium]
MQFNEILFEIKDNIAVLTLNRPDIRNAITGSEIISEIETACKLVNEDLNIKVLIITAKDPAFSSGGNIKDMLSKKGMFEGSSMQVMENYRKNIQRIPIALTNIEIPLIAAVNGPAIGAGLDMALMCDMRVASKKAKFGETFLNIGLIPGDGGAYFLPKVVGMAKACELTFTGDIIDAEEAIKIGLINYVVEHDRLMEKTYEIAGKIAVKPAFALRMTKRLLYMDKPLKYVLEQSAAYQALCHTTKEHEEALLKMLKK